MIIENNVENMIVRKICFLQDKKQLDRFFIEMDDNFRENSSLDLNPWTHRNLNNFHYMGCFEGNKTLLGVMVFSIYEVNMHLNFLYISSRNRHKGVGSLLIDFLLGTTFNIRIITTHVDNKLDQAINFYIKKGFSYLDEGNYQNTDLDNWIRRCIAYNPKTFLTKGLYYLPLI